MIELTLAMQTITSSVAVDFAGLVQVAVENAAAIKDLATAVYLLSKASKFLRKKT